MFRCLLLYKQFLYQSHLYLQIYHLSISNLLTSATKPSANHRISIATTYTAIYNNHRNTICNVYLNNIPSLPPDPPHHPSNCLRPPLTARLPHPQNLNTSQRAPQRQPQPLHQSFPRHLRPTQLRWHRTRIPYPPQQHLLPHKINPGKNHVFVGWAPDFESVTFYEDEHCKKEVRKVVQPDKFDTFNGTCVHPADFGGRGARSAKDTS